jgi:uncharacterized protein (DUF362 family)
LKKWNSIWIILINLCKLKGHRLKKMSLGTDG